MLKSFNLRPLVQRLDAVKEILETPSVSIEKLKSLLRNQPDMQRGLSRIQYGKVSSQVHILGPQHMDSQRIIGNTERSRHLTSSIQAHSC